MARRFEGRTALVTGGAGGQGYAVATILAEDGATVVVTDIVEPTGEQMDALRGLNPACRFMHLDVTDGAEGGERVHTVVEEFDHLDLLAHCAGITAGDRVLEESDDQWDRVLDINLRGTFLINRAAAREMARQGSGAIVNVSSGLANMAAPRRAAYAASKAGINALTRSLAAELGRSGVRVNAVAPWAVRTRMLTDQAAPEQIRPTNRAW